MKMIVSEGRIKADISEDTEKVFRSAAALTSKTLVDLNLSLNTKQFYKTYLLLLSEQPFYFSID